MVIFRYTRRTNPTFSQYALFFSFVPTHIHITRINSTWASFFVSVFMHFSFSSVFSLDICSRQGNSLWIRAISLRHHHGSLRRHGFVRGSRIPVAPIVKDIKPSHVVFPTKLIEAIVWGNEGQTKSFWPSRQRPWCSFLLWNWVGLVISLTHPHHPLGKLLSTGGSGHQSWIPSWKTRQNPVVG